MPQGRAVQTHDAARGLAVLLSALVVAGYAWHALSFWHYVNDDAYITFRYSRNLVDGLGPVYNAGERVEGYTNFSLMLLLSGVGALLGPASIPPLAKGLGVLCGAVSVVLTLLLVRDALLTTVGARLAVVAGAVAAVLVAATPGYALHSTSGLETQLFALALTAGAWTTARALSACRPPGAAPAFLFGLAVLTRPEAAALFAALWLCCAVVWWRDAPGGISERLRDAALRRWIGVGASVTLLFALHLGFRVAFYDGEWLPNTYYAKRGGFWGISPWAYVRAGLLAPLLGPAGVGLAALGLWLGRARLDRGLLPLLVLALTGGAMPFVTGPDWMPGSRLVVPYLPAAAALSVVGWWTLARCVPYGGPALGLVSVAAVPMALLLHWPIDQDLRALTRLRSRGYETGHRALAQWIADTTAPAARVALMDIGIVGYVCHRQSVLDLTGLTDRFIAKSEGPFLGKVYDLDYVLDQAPEVVVLTFSAPGVPYRVPPKGTAFDLWTAMEREVYDAEAFRRAYVRRRAPQPGEPWLDVLAAQIGAERVFEHAHPGTHYLLAAFRRRP